MILDYNCVDISNKSEKERESLMKGRCPKCNNDTFKRVSNSFVVGPGFECATPRCYESFRASAFRPSKVV